MHALVYRAWKNRVKGRDWYDFLWYVSNNVPLDFGHLAERVRKFNGEETDRESFMTKLKERLATADIKRQQNGVQLRELYSILLPARILRRRKTVTACRLG